MGLYDIHNEQFDETKFQPGKPLDPIIRVQGMKPPAEDEESDEDGSADSDLYYQFDSDEEVDK